MTFVRLKDLDPKETPFRVQIRSVESILRESSEAAVPGEDDKVYAARIIVDSLVRRRVVAPLSTPDGRWHMWVKILGVYVPDGGSLDDACEALVATPNADRISVFGGRMELQ